VRPLILRIKAGVARIELSRPLRHNAIDVPTGEALESAIDELHALGDRLACAVVTGAGPSFCSGADLTTLRKLSPRAARRFMLDAAWAFRRLEELPAPVLAGAKGYCLGGGLELLLHCDWVVAADDVTLGFPESTLGLVTTTGGVARLAAAVGSTTAKQMLLFGRTLDAREAFARGLVAEIVPASDLERALSDRSRALSRVPREGVVAAKALLRDHLGRAERASWAAEVEAFERLARKAWARGKGASSAR
jgi:enoyl-CoA hydratase